MTQAPPPLPHRGNDKVWAILCHISGLLGVGIILPLVVYLAMRDESEYVADNARTALNFHLSALIYCICSVPFIFIGIGVIFFIAIGVTTFVLSIVAAIKCSDGVRYEYPLCIPFIKRPR